MVASGGARWVVVTSSGRLYRARARRALSRAAQLPVKCDLLPSSGAARAGRSSFSVGGDTAPRYYSSGCPPAGVQFQSIRDNCMAAWRTDADHHVVIRPRLRRLSFAMHCDRSPSTGFGETLRKTGLSDSEVADFAPGRAFWRRHLASHGE